MKAGNFIVALPAVIWSLCLTQCDARSWTTPKPTTTAFVQAKAKNDSVIFSFIKTTEETSTEFEIDGSDSSFRLDFGKVIGEVSSDNDCGSGALCWKWTKDGASVASVSVSIQHDPEMETTVSQVHVVGPNLPHRYIFSHQGELLYGGPIDDIYPSNKDKKVDVPYITMEGGKKGPTKANAVVERVWYTSGGRAIEVSEETPLFVSQDGSNLILSVKHELPYPVNSEYTTSDVRILSTRNVKEAWMMMNAGKVKPSPPEVSVKKAMVSTWVAFKSNITQEKVLDFVRQIKEKDVDIGVLGVDDGWETCYGSQIFDLKKFPDPKKMIDEIHQMGHIVTFWVHPFVNTDCEAHERLKDYLVKYDNGTVVTTKWWNPPNGGMIDFLNETAADFYIQRLRKLQQDYGIDGFKFDAGEISYIPGLNQDFKIDVPNRWTKKYVEMAAVFGPLGEVRSGAGTSHANIRQRLQDCNSVWSVEEHGLGAVIPAMLQLTVAGYGATIPDYIGGNAYNEAVDRELYIRWTQLATFLPVMQFSILPWSFDNEVLEMTKKYISLHEMFSPYMLDLFYNEELTPVVAPLWWLEPNSLEALTCNDQFLVGDSILVAPVVKKGAVQRDIYFPPGVWKEVETGKTFEGPQTVKNFDAPLTKLPWFVRQRFATD